MPVLMFLVGEHAARNINAMANTNFFTKSPVVNYMPNVTVRGAPPTKAKRSRRTVIKTQLQNRQRAVRPFDRLVGLSGTNQSRQPPIRKPFI